MSKINIWNSKLIDKATIKWYMRMLIIMLRIDWAQARNTFVQKAIDRFVWIMSFVLAGAYLLPSLGITQNYGKFLLIGTIASLGIIEAYSIIALLIADLEGNQVILYSLGLPIPKTLFFIKTILYHGLYFSVLNIALFPLCNLVLPAPITYSSIAWGKTMTIIFISNFFYASLILFTSTFINDIRGLGKIWSRFLHPLLFLGGFQFTWAILHQKYPLLSYVALINPFFYTIEGLRAAILGQEGFLPFWGCIWALSIYTFIFFIGTVRRFSKRLDLV